MKRIGLFGGSFDPVHTGHLLVARAAIEELALDRLFFVPAAQSPFKPDVKPLAGHLRSRLLRLALAGQPEYAVCDLELERGGISFTIDTVQWFKQRYPESELHYLIGADHVATLPKWKGAEALAAQVDFAVVPRPGEASGWRPEAPSGFRCRYLQGHPLAISSSVVRQRILDGLPLDAFVPSVVSEVIRRYQLYSG